MPERPDPADMAGPDDEPTVELPIAYLPAREERRRVEMSARVRVTATGPRGGAYVILAVLGAVVAFAALVAVIRAL